MSEVSLYWAFKDNKLVHISEVLNGLKCGCLCPSCNGSLEAHNQGKIITHHFKHYNKSECVGALETSIHLAAKKLFLERKEVLTPDLYANVPEFYEQKVLSQKLYKASNVFEEYSLGDFKPDIFIEIDVQSKGTLYKVPLIVEIAVTHFIDNDKLSKITNKGISAIEIDISDCKLIKNDDDLWKELNNPHRIKWKFNSQLSFLIEKKRLNEIKYVKNIVEYNRRLNQEREKERNSISESKLELIKIYGIRPDYDKRDFSSGFTPIEGTVYCPKDKINNQNRKILLSQCEKCSFYEKKHFATTNSDSDVYVVCAFNPIKSFTPA